MAVYNGMAKQVSSLKGVNKISEGGVAVIKLFFRWLEAIWLQA